VDEIKDSSKD